MTEIGDVDCFETPDVEGSFSSGVIVPRSRDGDDDDAHHPGGGSVDPADSLASLFPPVDQGSAAASWLDTQSLSAVDALAKFRASDLQQQRQGPSSSPASAQQHHHHLTDHSSSAPALEHQLSETPLEKLHRLQFELEQLKLLTESEAMAGEPSSTETGAPASAPSRTAVSQIFPGHSVSAIADQLTAMQSQLANLHQSASRHGHLQWSAPSGSRATSAAAATAAVPPEAQLREIKSQVKSALVNDGDTAAAAATTTTATATAKLPSNGVQQSPLRPLEPNDVVGGRQPPWVSQLDVRLGRLEQVVGVADLSAAPAEAGVNDQSSADPGDGATAVQPIVRRVHQLEQYMALMDQDRLKEIKERVAELSSSGPAAASSAGGGGDGGLNTGNDDGGGPGPAPGTALTNAKLGELLSLVRQWEQPALMVPGVVDRLAALAQVHRQASAAAQSLDSLETRFQQATAQLSANHVIRQQLLKSLDQSATTMSENVQSLSERINKLVAQ